MASEASAVGNESEQRFNPPRLALKTEFAGLFNPPCPTVLGGDGSTCYQALALVILSCSV